jgi:hypothetical protein
MEMTREITISVDSENKQLCGADCPHAIDHPTVMQPTFDRMCALFFTNIERIDVGADQCIRCKRCLAMFDEEENA